MIVEVLTEFKLKQLINHLNKIQNLKNSLKSIILHKKTRKINLDKR